MCFMRIKKHHPLMSSPVKSAVLWALDSAARSAKYAELCLATRARLLVGTSAG